jgi:hypothetical protein
MGQGSNKAMGKSSIFSGSGSKQGLAAKIQKFNPSASQDMILSGQGPAKPTKKAGFNFSPVEGGKRGVSPDGQTLQRGQRGVSVDIGANNRGKDAASNFYDVDQDGDSIGNDYNQDGTMLGRGIKAAKKFFGGPGKVTDPKDGVVVSGDKDKVNNTVTKTNTKAQKLALLKEKKAIKKAKALEKVNEQKNLNQVKRDLIKNQKSQKKRELQGKDYQANTGEDNQKTVRRS